MPEGGSDRGAVRDPVGVGCYFSVDGGWLGSVEFLFIGEQMDFWVEEESC